MAAAGEPLYVHTGPAPPDTAAAVEQLDALIREHGAVLTIIDTMLRFVRVRDVAALNDGHRVRTTLEAMTGGRELTPVRIGRALGRIKDMPTGDLTLLAFKDEEANVQGYKIHRKNDGLL